MKAFGNNENHFVAPCHGVLLVVVVETSETRQIGRTWDMTLRGLLKASLEIARNSASMTLALPGL
jgi:hypothetical protein